MAHMVKASDGSALTQGDYRNQISGTKSKGSTIVGAGTPATDLVVNVPSTAKVMGAPNKGCKGVIDKGDTQKAVSAGVFATLTAGKYVVRGGGVTTELAGVAFDGLKGGAADNQRRISIPYCYTRKTVHITSWDYATGAATHHGSPHSDDFRMGQAGADDAVTTRAIPGEFCFIENGQTPSTKDYEAKTGG